VPDDPGGWKGYPSHVPFLVYEWVVSAPGVQANPGCLGWGEAPGRRYGGRNPGGAVYRSVAVIQPGMYSKREIFQVSASRRRSNR
jgi:hypothetical protein